MLSVRLTTIIAIVLIAVVSVVHEFVSSKELSLLLLGKTVQVEGFTSIRFRDNDIGNDEDKPYPPEHFCVEWSEQDADNRTIQPIDEWWTHHVEFEIASENATHQCFERELGSDKSIMHLQLYQNQFHTSCERVHKRYLWSSGWGADFKNVIGGLEEALEQHHVPFVMSWNPLYPKGWHYAANKGDFSNKTCPEQDLTCYFVSYHPCGKDNEVTNNTVGDVNGAIDFPNHPKALHVYQYVTRPLLWLRRSIFNFIEQQNLGLTRGQCSVIHVRRADVVMHGKQSRKYYPVKDYVDLLPPDVQQNHEILLLTDDQNAIEEAHEFFPEMKWRYLDRARHNGTSGGWENQTPSRNPAAEVITILGTFEMVKSCVHFVHGEGAFSDLVWAYMRMQNGHEIFEHRVDRMVNNRFSLENQDSPEQLQIQLEELRKEQRGGGYVADHHQQEQPAEPTAEEAQPEAELEQPPEEEPQTEAESEHQPHEEETQPGAQVEEPQPESEPEQRNDQQEPQREAEQDQRSNQEPQPGSDNEVSLPEPAPEQPPEEEPQTEAAPGQQSNEVEAQPHAEPEQTSEDNAQPEAEPKQRNKVESQSEGETEPESDPEQQMGEEESEPETGFNKSSVEEVKEQLERVRREKEEGLQRRRRRRQLRRLRVEEEMWPLGPTFETELGR